MRAISPTDVALTSGQVWVIELTTCADDLPLTGTVTLPDDTTDPLTFEATSSGTQRAVYVTSTPGRYIGVAQNVSGASQAVSAYATDVTSGGGMPDLTEIKAYLTSIGGVSASDGTIQDAFDAEAAAQRQACRTGPTYPDDLRQALKRRVARNLTMRRLLNGGSSDADLNPFVPGRDPEVRRLEGPYRKLVIG